MGHLSGHFYTIYRDRVIYKAIYRIVKGLKGRGRGCALRSPFIRDADASVFERLIILLFDFDRFSKIAASVYNDNNLYSLDDCLSVFRCYFETYEEFTGRVHPPIRASQISRIMQDMPYIDRQLSPESTAADIEPDHYPLIIQLHFKTRYRNCDYNINHFFSGQIRDYRIMEANKGYE